MNDPDTIELIQQEIDGANEPHETERLRVRLGADPHARDLFDAFAALAAELDALAILDPPAGLPASVVDRIRERREVTIHAAPALARARNGTDRRWIARAIYAAAAGVVIGLLLAPLVADRRDEPPSFDWVHASGSMVRPGALVLEKEILAPSVRGSVALHREDDRIAVVVNLRTSGPSDLELRFDPSRLALEGFHREPPAGLTLAASPGVLTMSSAGPETATVLLRRLGPDTGSLALSIRAGLATTEITLPTETPP